MKKEFERLVLMALQLIIKNIYHGSTTSAKDVEKYYSFRDRSNDYIETIEKEKK
jgi:hypothetical protein